MLRNEIVELDSDNTIPEIWSSIFLHLSPENLTIVSLVSNLFKNISRSNFIWEIKTAQHFPLHHQSILNKNEINWYLKFQTFYKLDYQKIDECNILTYAFKKTFSPNSIDIRIKEIFSMLKEGDLNRLKLFQITPSDLDRVDNNDISLIEYAIYYKHQHVLDYFYNLIWMNYGFNDEFDSEVIDHDNRSILHWSILCHQPKEYVRSLIELGCDINAKTNNGDQAIHYACQYGFYELVELLLTLDPNLLDITDNLRQTPTIWAAANGHTQIVRYLASLGADIHQTTLQPNEPCNKFNALHWATKNRHIDTVSALIQLGAETDTLSHAGAAIHIACSNGHTNIVKHLVMNHPNTLNQKDGCGQTPIIWAASRGYTDIVDFLAQQGAELNHITNQMNDKNNGNTALHWAAICNHPEAVKILLKYNASSTTCNATNETADHLSENMFIRKIISLDRHIQSLKKNKVIHSESYSNLNLFSHDKIFYLRTIDAAIALESVVLGISDPITLNIHEREFRNGELKSFFEFFTDYIKTDLNSKSIILNKNPFV